MNNVFVYGSLMFDEVWDRLVQKPYKKLDANLAGYKRLRVCDEDYPGLVKFSAGDVDGKLYLNVTEHDLARLDHFEGEYYKRESVIVRVGVEEYPAEVFVFCRVYRHLLCESEWSVGHFARKGLHRFLSRYTGFQGVDTRF